MDNASVLGTRHLAPSFARCRGVRERWYVVGDPAVLRSGEWFTDTATIDDRIRWARLIRGPAVGLVTGGLFGIQYNTVAAVAIFAIVGLLIGVIVVAVRGERRKQRRQSRAVGRVVRVEPPHRDAWEFCELAEHLTATRAWSSGLVNQDRVVPQLLWRVVSTCGHLTAMEADVAEAERHPGLADVAEQRRQHVGTLRAELDAVRRGLENTLDAAHELDAREQAHRAEQARRESEADLRERLTGSAELPPEQLADAIETLEGVQAAAVAVNELLTETDRIAGTLPNRDR